MVLADAHKKDRSLTIGLKLPPYVFNEQFISVLDSIRKFSYCIETKDGEGEKWTNPFAFFTCTNTLGNSFLFSSQTTTPISERTTAHALPNETGIGGLAGEHLHPLALGNVRTFTSLLASSPPDQGLGNIKVLGVGGVVDKEGVQRMRDVGATVVGCASVFGKNGVGVFEKLAAGL